VSYDVIAFFSMYESMATQQIPLGVHLIDCLQ